MRQRTVVSVLVTYFPDESILERTLVSLLHQVDTIFVVDNTPGGSNLIKTFSTRSKFEKVIPIFQIENIGISKAQNIGINEALIMGASFILLSDQDTEYPSNYVDIMTENICRLMLSDKIAAILPQVEELNSGKLLGFEMFEKFRLKRIYFEGCHEIGLGISSGKIINVDAIKEIGLLNDRMFLDWVDTEWCLRAKSKGYKLYGCSSAIIRHSLGDDLVVFNGKNYSVRGPERHYYMVRNAVYLALYNSCIDFNIRIFFLIKSIRYLVGFPIVNRPFFRHLKYTLLGFAHGLINKMGKIDI